MSEYDLIDYEVVTPRHMLLVRASSVREEGGSLVFVVGEPTEKNIVATFAPGAWHYVIRVPLAS